MHTHDEEELKRIFEDVLPSQVRTRNVEGYVSLFTKDATWCPPNAFDRNGRAEIAQGFAAVIANQSIDPIFTADKVSVIERFGYVFGESKETLHPLDGSPSSIVHTRELWQFHKEEDDTWKISRMIWNVKPG